MYNQKDIVLIPIAVDSDLVSLDSLLEDYEISQYPVVIINQKDVLEKIDSVADLEKYLI